MGIFSRDKMIAELLQSRCLWEYALNLPSNIKLTSAADYCIAQAQGGPPVEGSQAASISGSRAQDHLAGCCAPHAHLQIACHRFNPS